MGGKKNGGGEDLGPGAKAKAQKAQARQQKEAEAQAKKEARDNANWSQGANTKAEERERQRLEKEAAKAALKAAKKAQEEEDQIELNKMRAPAGKARKAAGKKKKNDLSALDAYLEQDKKAKEAKAKKQQERAQDPLLQPNLNRQRAAAAAEGHVEASGIDAALDALSFKEETEKAPGRKAAYLSFEERMMPALKEEYPTLKRSQLKEKIWKEWLKSPENPENQNKEK